MPKIHLTSNRLIILLSIYCITLFNVGFFRSVWQYSLLETGRDWILVLTMPLVMFIAIFWLLQIWVLPKLHWVTVPLMLIFSASVSYAVMVQKIYFNADQLTNVLQTTRAEASAWMNPQFFLWMGLTAILPSILYWLFIRIRPSAKRWYARLGWRMLGIVATFTLLAILKFTVYEHYAFFFRVHKQTAHQIVPLNYISATVKYHWDNYQAHQPFEKIGEDAKRIVPEKLRKQVLILVVGETTRAKNWGLNPDAPETTPQLKAIDGVINYPNTTSCATATAQSVPCLMSNMSRNGEPAWKPTKAKHQESLMDILNRVGLYTFWRENDGGCKGVCDRIKHIDIRQLAEAGQCQSEGCLDMALLNGLQQEVEDMPNDGVIVLHTMGSHGPAYFERYTPEFRKFTPTCDTNQIQSCSQEALINTYNNTIVYIDHMLAATIKLLDNIKDINAALYFFSDHGESLGENGMYLHAAPYAIAPKEQTHIPMIFWANQNWYQDLGWDETCLKKNANTAVSHDNIFHSVLGIFNIETQVYQKSLDMFAQCRK